MMPDIRLPDYLFERLQKHATPFVDSPATVIERLLDSYEGNLASSKESPKQQSIHRKASTKSRQMLYESGYWFVNVGENDHRNWDDCLKYSFIAAGWEYYTNQLRKLGLGDKVFAYLKGKGYVGFGEVVQEACSVDDFVPSGSQEALLKLPLVAEDMDHSQNEPENREWVVGMKWHKTFAGKDAKTFPGIFAGRHIVCRLSDKWTLDFLQTEFNAQPPEQ